MINNSFTEMILSTDASNNLPSKYIKQNDRYIGYQQIHHFKKYTLFPDTHET